MTFALLRSLLIISLGVQCAFALEPAPRPNPERFAKEIAAFARLKPEKGGIVFTGSSSIRLWSRLKEDFPGLPIVNSAFGGCISNDLVVYFEAVVARHEPKLVVAYVGSNDLEERLSVEEAFADYTKFLSMIHEQLPKSRVILNSVKIAPRRAIRIPQVYEFNKRLETWAVGKDWLRFVDTSSYLADPQDIPIPAYFREDDLHLSAAGYEKWQAILDPVLREEWAKAQ